MVLKIQNQQIIAPMSKPDNKQSRNKKQKKTLFI